MNFRIAKLGAMTRGEMIKSFFRWLIYAVLLLVFLVMQITMPFFKCQPLLTVALACTVSLFEGELSGSVFAAVAGMVTDISLGGLFGFTSIWLVPCCLFITLLVVNLIHRNLINCLIMTLCTLLIVDAAELFFKHIIWRAQQINVIVLEYMLPSIISTIVLAAPLYLLIKFVNNKLGNEVTERNMIASFNELEEDEERV